MVAEIVTGGGKAMAVQADIMNATDVEGLFEVTMENFGSLDVLVNNASVYKLGPVESITEKDFHRHFNSNVLSVFLATQQAVKRLGPKGGSVIKIATAGVSQNPPWTSLYIATKSAAVVNNAHLTQGAGGERFVSTRLPLEPGLQKVLSNRIPR